MANHSVAEEFINEEIAQDTYQDPKKVKQKG